MPHFRLTAVAVALALPLFAQTPPPPDAPSPDAKPVGPKAYPDKLTHAPTPVPDRIILTWTGDTATTQAVTWRTDTTVDTGLGQVAEATDGPTFDPLAAKPGVVGDGVREFPAVTQKLANPLNDAHYHSVTFTGLKPNTVYVYRVGAGADWSGWNQFRTASDKPAPVGFIYVGDAQDAVKRHWSRLIRQAYSDMPKANFLLHAGDLISTGDNDGQWGEWHQSLGWVNASTPSIPTPGNHEYAAAPKTAEEKKADALAAAVGGGPTGSPAKRKSVLTNHWRAQFALPENGPAGLEESCYHIDCQGVRVVCLNSMERVAEQTDWLERVLRDNPNRWTVVTFHVPVYSLTAARQKGDVEKEVRKYWRPLFDKYGVDLVLQGHDHSYGRSGLMREDNVLANAAYDQKGAVYVVSVSGPKMYDLNAMPWMVSSAQKKQLYQLVRVDGDTLSFEARTANGELFDQFELRKQASGRSVLVEQGELAGEKVGGGLTTREGLFAVGGIVLLVSGMFAGRWLFRPKVNPPAA